MKKYKHTFFTKKVNLVLLLLIMVGCAKLPFVTEPTKVEIVANPKITLGKLNDCSLTGLPEQESSTFVELWVKNNTKLTAEKYPIILSYNIPQGNIAGIGHFERDGQRTGTSYFIDLEGQKENVTMMNKLGDVNFPDQSNSSDYDSILSFVFVPRTTQNILPGQNSITLTIPLKEWEIAQGNDDTEVVISSDNVFIEGALTTTCRF